MSVNIRRRFRKGYGIRKFRDDKIHLLKRMTLEEREIQTLPAVLGVA
jgi:hypothetical protein